MLRGCLTSLGVLCHTLHIDMNRFRQTQLLDCNTREDIYYLYQFLFKVTVSLLGLISFKGTHLSPQRGEMTSPTNKFLGLDLDWVGSTITVLPTDRGADVGSLSRTRCSCSGSSVTFCLSFTVPILSGMGPPLHFSELESRDKNLEQSSLVISTGVAKSLQ